MMKRLPIKNRTLGLVGILALLLVSFIYVAVRSGPFAAVPVMVATVENRAITPALFGIGTVEVRYTYKIGPTSSGRVKQVTVQAGDRVRAGQLLGEMDPVDFDERIIAQEAQLKRAAAAVLAAEAQFKDVESRKNYAESQARRYEKLFQGGYVSAETAEAMRREHQVAEAGSAAALANVDAARQEHTRVRADGAGLTRQRANLRLIAPMDGLVSARSADPGTTVVAGQAVVEVIDPKSLWINVRFDQLGSSSLRPGLPVRITLRSQAGHSIAGKVLRVENLADAVTEEILAKVAFDAMPELLPSVNELAEATVALSALPPSPVAPNASVTRVDGRLGVWMVEDGKLRFAPVKVGASDLDGHVQILEGLKAGDRIVAYSQRALNSRSRIKVVHRLPGVSP
jgi:multidrug efflux pump subunit AcrA (membrane-fusion protein)